MYSKLMIVRKERKLTQSQLAKILNISEGAYFRKENRKVDFTLTEAVTLASYFDTTLDDLFGV